MLDADADLGAVRDEAVRVLAAWGMTPTEIQVVGAVPGMAGTILRPVVDLRGGRYLLRRQPPGLTAADLRFRHAFMDHLARAGLPAPTLLPRPDGATCTITENGVYEAQEWLDGEMFVSEGAEGAAQLEAAGRMLGRLHQASADFQWQPHRWPDERSGDGLARSYIELIRQAAEHSAASEAVANGLTRIADACDERREATSAALAVEPAPPQLHIHGDYQAHNLRFGAGGPIGPAGPAAVSAIYDFDAARWDTRLLELAYSLLFFTGVRWDDSASPTPPLVDDGLDILRAHRYLGAYGREAPPAEEEARLLSDALALVFPIVFVNGVAEDLIFPDDFEAAENAEDGLGGATDEDALARLHWADTFWLWLDRYRDALAQAWQSGG